VNGPDRARRLTGEADPRTTPVLSGGTGRIGTALMLHLTWSVVAGFLALVIGWALASLVAGVVPVPRRYVVTGIMTTLAVAAGWATPMVLGRMSAHHRAGSILRMGLDRHTSG
jgi:hypothetical protein